MRVVVAGVTAYILYSFIRSGTDREEERIEDGVGEAGGKVLVKKEPALRMVCVDYTDFLIKIQLIRVNSN